MPRVPSLIAKTLNSGPTSRSSITTALAGLAKPSLKQSHRVPFGRVQILGKKNTLAGGESARLDYRLVTVFPGPKCAPRRCRIPDHGVAGRRNPVTAHEILREFLGGLENRGVLPGPETGNVPLGQPIGEARRERSFRPGDHQIHTLCGCEIRESRDVLRPYRSEARQPPDPGVPGSRDQLFEFRTPRNRPSQRVFAPAAADQQNPHGGVLLAARGETRVSAEAGEAPG